ncbi:protein phosphatase 2C domain-containing protein [Actinacidiphila oryziradicis]|uniref:protein phosphatase 2C domain-containing protein n=1 Tax=Actinacidiphila oryziradicis TaxID=2571141 RepID=UPI0023F0255F|nr:protein phosphatase 2C domain-containing protein [Actinacidiphila oryziradicis]MCW2869938.1 hypothetical protein [Actinacidiphila oryziradicis]
MSQQGETDHRQEDDWWQQLYGRPGAPEAPDTGPSAASEPRDSVDAHFTSAIGALGAADSPDDAPSAGLPRQYGGAAAPTPPPAAAPDPDPVLDLDMSRALEPEPEPEPVPEPGPAGSADPRWPYPAPPALGGRPQPTRGPARPTSSGQGEASWPAPAPELPPGWAPVDPPAPEEEPAPWFELAPAKPREPVGPPQPEAPPEEPADGVPGFPPAVASVPYVGDRPPTYEPEPTAWPTADPEDLDSLVPDTVLDGARYGVLTLRTASVRGDSARYRGEPRRDALLTARFGAGDDALLLLAVATGARAAEESHRAARDACRWIAEAVGRSHVRLSEDIRAARRGSLKSGLHRLTDRCYGRLRTRGEELGLAPAEYSAALRCLLVPADPECRIRLFLGVGDGGLFRIRGGEWQDLDQAPGREGREGRDSREAGDGKDGKEEIGVTFRFRFSVAQPGDALILCSTGLAEPLRGEPALAARLREQWGTGEPPGLAAFLSDAQTRVKGYADDRTAVGVWDA